MEVRMLTEDGPKILEAIRYTRNLMEQVALLLQTSDKLLGEIGWECIHGNTTHYESSASLLIPKHWIPKDAFRFYMLADKSWNAIIVVSVLIDDVSEGYSAFNEPLITAACLVNDRNISYDDVRKNGYHYWWARYHGWDSGDKNGKISEIGHEDLEEEQESEILYSVGRATFGYPLVAIKDANDLKAKIVDPLIDLAKKMEEGSD